MSDPLASIPLSAIRVFEAAARLRSFTRAAAELGITQAAVSWQVKALEKRLDQPLFVRLTREVALTEAGERLSRAASEAMNGLRAALADLTETGDGVLAITCLPSLANLWLGPRIGGFQLQHPQIAVRLETSGRLADLGRENLDIAFRTGGGDWPGLASHFLFPTIQTPLCTAETRERLGLSNPRDLLAAQRIGAPEEWRVWFAAAGVETGQDPPAVPRLMGDSQVLEVASAASGQGVALGSPILFAADLASGRLVAPFDVCAHYGPGHWLAYRADRARTRKIRAFRDWMLALVADDPVIARFPRRAERL
jgi:LysR family glycine cleavage system transcriptional activator